MKGLVDPSLAGAGSEVNLLGSKVLVLCQPCPTHHDLVYSCLECCMIPSSPFSCSLHTSDHSRRQFRGVMQLEPSSV